MRFVFALIFTICVAPAFAAEIAATSKVDAVTVFPRGAEISRTFKQPLEAGNHTIIVEDLPAGAQLNSIRVEGRADGELTIGTVDSKRVFVLEGDAEAQAGTRRQLEDQLEKLNDEMDQLRAIVETKEAQKTFVNNLASLPARPSGDRNGQGKPVDWSNVLGLIGTSMTNIQRDLLATRIRMRDTSKEIEDVKKKLAGLAPKQLQRTQVKINLRAGAALTADLVIKYQVGRASWQPLYDARLATSTSDNPAGLKLIRRAAIRQQTGEAWQDVALTLSTARPSARSSAPSLSTLTVDFKREVPVAGYRKDSRLRQVERKMAVPAAAVRERAEDQSAQTTSRAAGQVAREQDATLQQSAFQASFQVPGRTTIANTGDPKGVRLGEDDIKPGLLVRTVPKRDQKAYLYAKLKLPDGAPYLPGTVSLFRDGSFVGTGRLPALAPGADHELGFGTDNNVTVKYAVKGEKRGESGIISSSRTDQRDYQITVENGHTQPIDVTVIDQMPVSLNEEITVELTGATPPSKRNYEDKRGLLAWQSRVEPGKKRDIKFGYTIAWPADKDIRFGRRHR